MTKNEVFAQCLRDAVEVVYNKVDIVQGAQRKWTTAPVEPHLHPVCFKRKAAGQHAPSDVMSYQLGDCAPGTCGILVG